MRHECVLVRHEPVVQVAHTCVKCAKDVKVGHTVSLHAALACDGARSAARKVETALFGQGEHAAQPITPAGNAVAGGATELSRAAATCEHCPGCARQVGDSIRRSPQFLLLLREQVGGA